MARARVMKPGDAASAKNPTEFAHGKFLVGNVMKRIEANHAIEELVRERKSGFAQGDIFHFEVCREWIPFNQLPSNGKGFFRYVCGIHLATEQREYARQPAGAGSKIKHARASKKVQLWKKRSQPAANACCLAGTRERLARNR